MTPCCWSIPSNSFGTTEQIPVPLHYSTMKTEITYSFWKIFLLKNTRFVGFGNLAASTVILSDNFLVDPSSDELEVMFQLEKVGSSWMEKLNSETWKAKDLNLLPKYANYYFLNLANRHALPITQQALFCIPLAGDHLYFENREVWIKTLRKKLVDYQTLIQSFPRIYYNSNFISPQETKELLNRDLNSDF